MASTVQKRIQLHQDWAFDLPLKSLWGIQFSPVANGDMTHIGNNVEKTIKHYTGGGTSHMYKVIPDQLERAAPGGEEVLLAQTVGMPTENFAVNTLDQKHVGGFIQGYVGGNRSPFGSQQKLDVTFIETNTDIIDFFIKPWVVAASYRGLIIPESEADDIRCNISVRQYSRSSAYYNDKWASSQNPRRPAVSYDLRKVYTFFNCVPFNVDADSLSYDEVSLSDLMRTVSFTFSHYKLNTDE